MDLNDSILLPGSLHPGRHDMVWMPGEFCHYHRVRWQLSPPTHDFTKVDRIEMHNGSDIYVVSFNHKNPTAAEAILRITNEIIDVCWYAVLRAGEIPAFAVRGRYSNTPPIFGRGKK